MTDDDAAISEVLNPRSLTAEEEDALSRVEHFVSRHDFVSQRRPRVAAELLVAGVVAAAIASVTLALTRHVPPVPVPAGSSPPLVSSPATPTPSLAPAITSTVVASPPLVLYWVSTDPSYRLAALTYSGQSEGVLVVPYSGAGFEVAPDGSKVLDGDQIIGVHGTLTGSIVWTSGELPIWGDDSAHLCGIANDLSPGGRTTLVEFDTTGARRTVRDLGPTPSQTSWQVLACSPEADRVVVVQQGNYPLETIQAIRLSTGALLTSHVVSDASSGVGTPVASQDGRIIAVNESWGIVVRDGSTWALLARIVRWGSQAGYPMIGSATTMSWDGSRIVIDGGGASGADHPMWLVDWVDNRNVLTSASSPGLLLSGVGDIVPLLSRSSFFIRGGPAGDTLYVLHDNGKLQKLAG
jgi:hypothetical protein